MLSASVVYHTNQQSSDELSVAAPQDQVLKSGHTTDDLISVRNDARLSPDASTSTRKAASTGREAKHSSEKAPRNKEVRLQKSQGIKEVPVIPTRKMARGDKAAELTAKKALSAGKSTKPLGRTRSAQIREEVFGASDEELSEVDDEDDAPTAAPSVSSTKLTATKDPKLPVRSTAATKDDIAEDRLSSLTKARRGAARRVLDSDDEAGERGPGDTGLRSIGPRKKRVAPPTPDVSDIDLDPLEKSFVTPPRSQVNTAAAPVTPTKALVGRPPIVQEPSSPAVDASDVAMSLDVGLTLPENVNRPPSRPLIIAEYAAEPVVAASSYMPRSVSRKIARQPTVASSDAQTSAVDNVLTERTPNTRNDAGHAFESRAKLKPTKTVDPIPIDFELSDHGTPSGLLFASYAEPYY